MNLLGYIFAILVLVSIAFQSYYTHCLYDRKIRQSYSGHQQACKHLQKAYVEYNFEKIPEKKSPSSPKIGGKEKKKGIKPKVFLKKELTPSCMRLNLWPILKDKDPSHFIYQSFKNLIVKLYCPHIIEPKNVSSFINEYVHLLAESQEKSSKICLEQIQFSTPSFQRIYYQMLSHEFSLLNYIKVHANQKTCLECSDEILLDAMFNREIANRCVQNRLHPMHKLSISKDLLEDWIRIYGMDPFILSYLRCKHSEKDNTERTIIAKDQPSDIVLKQKIPSFVESSKIRETESKL